MTNNRESPSPDKSEERSGIERTLARQKAYEEWQRALEGSGIERILPPRDGDIERILPRVYDIIKLGPGVLTTKKELKKAGVTRLGSDGPMVLRCDSCKHEWSPGVPDTVLTRGYWYCPNGCNHP